MSDDFKPGDYAVRVKDDVPGNPDPNVIADRTPPLNSPVLVVSVGGMRVPGGRYVSGIRLAGYPIKCRRGQGFWNARYFRKVPPPETIEEPRRVAEPLREPA